MGYSSLPVQDSHAGPVLRRLCGKTLHSSLSENLHYQTYNALSHSGFRATLPASASSIRRKVESLSFGSLALIGR